MPVTELLFPSEIVPAAFTPRFATVIVPLPDAVTLPPERIASVVVFAGEIAALTVTAPDVSSPIRSFPAVIRSISASEISKVFAVVSTADPILIAVFVVNGTRDTTPVPALMAFAIVTFWLRITVSVLAPLLVTVPVDEVVKLVEAEMSIVPFVAVRAAWFCTTPPIILIGPAMLTA